MKKVGNGHFLRAGVAKASIGLVLICLSACAQVRERQVREREYDAYGETWKYFTVERYTKSWGFGSPHGVYGMLEGLEQFVYLVTSKGERIPVHERIYALQKDESYRKVKCCDKVLMQAEVYKFDEKLVVYFKQFRENITDCFVCPSGHPDDEKEPDSGKRYRYVRLFGEFDPQAKRFYVRDFLPGL